MSDDDTLDTEVLLGRPARDLPLGCGRCGWRRISCVYASVNLSQLDAMVWILGMTYHSYEYK